MNLKAQDLPKSNQAIAVDEGVESHAFTKNDNLLKTGLLVVLVGLLVYVILDYTVPGLGFVADTLKEFLDWVEDNPGEGFVAFAAVYVLTTVCFIPGSLLTLGAGLAFGRALGI
ncbi:unnamed protein product [Choristocarpus tenellus]